MQVIWLLGQVVKTPPSHGGYGGSNPPGVTRIGNLLLKVVVFTLGKRSNLRFGFKKLYCCEITSQRCFIVNVSSRDCRICGLFMQLTIAFFWAGCVFRLTFRNKLCFYTFIKKGTNLK